MDKQKFLKSKPNINKLVVLIIGLIFTLLMISKLPQSTSFENLISTLTESAQKINSKNSFSDDQKSEIQKLVAGFWIYKSNFFDSISMDDRIELKDNGIIWRVTKYFYTLPSGRIDTVTHVEHAYCVPYSYDVYDSLNIVCDYYIIRQATIFGEDSCYEDRKDPKPWRITLLNTMVSHFDSIRYKPFPKDSIQTFFPEGLIHIVDKFDLKRCYNSSYMSKYIEQEIALDLQNEIVQEYDSLKVIHNLTKFYIPYCLLPNLQFHTIRNDPLPIEFTVHFKLNWKGSLDSVAVSLSDKIFNKNKNKVFIEETIKNWKFNTLFKSQPSRFMSLTVKQ